MNVGRVLGTLDAMPLEFWVGVEDGQFLQLDDVVVVETPLPDGRLVRLFGVVDVVRARHEGATFDSGPCGERRGEERAHRAVLMQVAGVWPWVSSPASLARSPVFRSREGI